jgi:hypothetical protein
VSKKKREPIINFATGKPVAKTAQKAMHEAYAARLGARKMARSGHPGKAAEGRKGVADITEYIEDVYSRDTMGLLQ